MWDLVYKNYHKDLLSKVNREREAEFQFQFDSRIITKLVFEHHLIEFLCFYRFNRDELFFKSQRHLFVERRYFLGNFVFFSFSELVEELKMKKNLRISEKVYELMEKANNYFSKRQVECENYKDQLWYKPFLNKRSKIRWYPLTKAVNRCMGYDQTAYELRGWFLPNGGLQDLYSIILYVLNAELLNTRKLGRKKSLLPFFFLLEPEKTSIEVEFMRTWSCFLYLGPVYKEIAPLPLFWECNYLADRRPSLEKAMTLDDVDFSCLNEDYKNEFEDFYVNEEIEKIKKSKRVKAFISEDLIFERALLEVIFLDYLEQFYYTFTEVQLILATYMNGINYFKFRNERRGVVGSVYNLRLMYLAYENYEDDQEEVYWQFNPPKGQREFFLGKDPISRQENLKKVLKLFFFLLVGLRYVETLLLFKEPTPLSGRRIYGGYAWPYDGRIFESIEDWFDAEERSLAFGLNLTRKKLGANFLYLKEKDFMLQLLGLRDFCKFLGYNYSIKQEQGELIGLIKKEIGKEKEFLVKKVRYQCTVKK